MSTALIQFSHQLLCPLSQRIQHFSTILETARSLHIRDCISLDFCILRLLLEDVQELHVSWSGTDAVNDREGEFAFRQILAHAFVGEIFGGGEVLVVVTDLKKYSDKVDEGDAVSERLLVSIRSNEKKNLAYFCTELSACINLMANLNSPPVLFPTISR